MILSDRVQRMEESKTIMMARLTRQLRAQGKDVITLSLGDIDFNTPDYVKQAAKQAIDQNFSHYPPVEGFADLIDAIINKFYSQTDYLYRPEQILVSNGAKHTLANIILATINPGDEVILPAPYWVTYNELVNLAGGKQVYIKASIENNWKITAEQIQQAITPKTKLIILNNPNNPTGAVYTYQELAEIARVVARHPNILLISDEVYDSLTYEQPFISMGVFDSIRQQLVLVNAVSKTYAMTGWRVGFMAGPKWLVAACKKLQGQMTSGVNAIAQKAAAAALRNGQDIISERREIMRRRRDVMFEYFGQIPEIQYVKSQGSFYAFPVFDAYLGTEYEGKIIENTTDLSMYLLEQANVAVVAGEAFGYPGAMRFSFAIDQQVIRKAMERIIHALKLLRPDLF